MPPAIELVSVSKWFGRVPAVMDVSASFEQGKVAVLIGANGSGKTTLLQLVAGLCKPSRGRIRLFGKDASALGHRRFWKPENLSYGFQFPRSLSKLDLTSNVLVGANPGIGRSLLTAVIGEGSRLRSDTSSAERVARSATGKPPAMAAAALSFGERRRLELGRVRIAEPSVILLDEPFAGLDRDARIALANAIQEWRQEGRSVIFTGHEPDQYRGVVDRFVFLRAGKIVEDGPAPPVRPGAASPTSGARPTKTLCEGRVLAAVSALTAGYDANPVFEHFSFALHAGQAIAFVGPNGSGKSTALRALTGLLPWVRGSIVYFGRDEPSGPSRWLGRKGGLSYSIQGARIFPSMTVAENLQTAVQKLATANERRAALSRATVLLPALNDWLDREAGSLSGGQRQLLSLGQSLATEPQVLLLDEPAEGLSTEHRETIVRALRECLRNGTGIILVEHDASIIDQLADEIWCFSRGEAPVRLPTA